MAYKISAGQLDGVIEKLIESYHVYAPCLLEGWGTFANTDIVGYSKVCSGQQIVFDKKSMYSFKEAILPISQTMFYFTEDEMKEPEPIYKKAIVFLRNCDLHGLKRLDDIYRCDGKSDYYYEQLRSNAKFVVMGCESGFDSCFCKSMGTDAVADFDAYIIPKADGYIVDARFDELTEVLAALEAEKTEFSPPDITNTIKIKPPEFVPEFFVASPMWDEYETRCITCGRCNFVCPTCACFTTQDIFYDDNKNVGERRRVWASCQIDGYTDIAGGMCYRKNKGERMRFKTLHKISDHKKRYGQNMCVGCGRCDDVCPEYISFSACLEKVAAAVKEEQHG